jgi:hypothetical protein
MPQHLMTREYMLGIKEHLVDNGYALFNIIANPTFSDAYSRRIDNTIRSAFGSCAAIPTQFKNAPTNIIYACSMSGRTADRVVYVDNLNNSTTDSFNW